MTPLKSERFGTITAQEWANKYITKPLQNKAFSPHSPISIHHVHRADGLVVTQPIETVALCFRNRTTIHVKTKTTLPLVTATPIAFVDFVEGTIAGSEKLFKHATMQFDDILIPMALPLDESSRWAWRCAVGDWIGTEYDPNTSVVGVVLLSALQSVLYAMSQTVDNAIYERHVEFWMHLLRVACQYWKHYPESRGSLDALWYDDRARDSLQRSVACWARPCVNVSSEQNVPRMYDDHRKLTLVETMLRRHWKDRNGIKKARSLCRELPLGLVTCCFLMTQSDTILRTDIKTQNDWDRLQTLVMLKMTERFSSLSQMILQFEQGKGADDLGNAKFVQFLMEIVTDESLLLPTDPSKLVSFVKDCYDQSTVGNRFHVDDWLRPHLPAFPFPIWCSNLYVKRKEILPPRVCVLMTNQETKETKDTKEALMKINDPDAKTISSTATATSAIPCSNETKANTMIQVVSTAAPTATPTAKPPTEAPDPKATPTAKPTAHTASETAILTEEKVLDSKGPPGGLSLALAPASWMTADVDNDKTNHAVRIEPSECAAWNVFVLPTNKPLRLLVRPSLCGGGQEIQGRTWGKNACSAVRFVLSNSLEESGKDVVHDMLNRNVGVASSGTLFDPNKEKSFGKPGGWKPYPVLKLTEPFQITITKTHVEIARGAQLRDVWWNVAHSGKPLIVGFNYVVLHLQRVASLQEGVTLQYHNQSLSNNTLSPIGSLLSKVLLNLAK